MARGTRPGDGVGAPPAGEQGWALSSDWTPEPLCDLLPSGFRLKSRGGQSWVFGTQLEDTTGPRVSDGTHTPRAPWGWRGAGLLPDHRQERSAPPTARLGVRQRREAAGPRRCGGRWARTLLQLSSLPGQRGRAGLQGCQTHMAPGFSQGPRDLKSLCTAFVASYVVSPEKSTCFGTERSLMPRLLSPGRPPPCWPRGSSSSLPRGRGAAVWSLWAADRQRGALGHRSEEQQIKGSRQRLQMRPAPPATCRASLSQKEAGSSASQPHQARPSSTELWPPCPRVLTATTSSEALLASGPSNTCCAGPRGPQARPCHVPLLPGLQGSRLAREDALSSGGWATCLHSLCSQELGGQAQVQLNLRLSFLLLHPGARPPPPQAPQRHGGG